jgi:uncharacterized protein (TIGR03435 family)
MRLLKTTCAALAALLVVGVVARAEPQTTAQKPQFEVASVKPNKSGQPPTTQGSPLEFLLGGRFTATNVTLVDVIVRVYPTRRIQMQGGPNWIDSDRFDIVAKADEGQGKVTPGQMVPMVQSLLEDRFQLRFHVEKREMQVYALTLGKDRPKVQEAKDGGITGVTRGERGQLIFQKMTIVGLVNTMANMMRTPVVDGTGMKGFYDFILDPVQFLTPAATNGRRPDNHDIADAVVAAAQEQLGFKLERRKELLDITVIDHAEQPSEN